jgi:hypothetical protein
MQAINQSQHLRTFPQKSPAPRGPENTGPEKNVDWDIVDPALVGATPVVGGMMNLVYGGSVSLLSQSWGLASLSVLGAAANAASLPLLVSGNYLGAAGALAISSAAHVYVHNKW